MHLGEIAGRVAAGETVTFVARGQSMTPLVNDGDRVTVVPIEPPVKKGEVVLAKVNGRWYFHKVIRVTEKRALIGNNHGHLNGWTPLSNVIGRLG